MSLKLIRSDTGVGRTLCVAAAVFAVIAGLLFARAFFVRTLATRLDLANPAAGAAVDWLVTSGGSDPDSHRTAAVYYEQTFEVADLTRSLTEFEEAVKLSPHNYLLWLDLARARGRAGDADGAEAAYRQARQLAPNYADVQWAYGNFLVRQGREDEGFPLIAQAAAADPQLAASGVSLLLQLNGGDAARAHALLGNDPAVNSALATTLLSLKKYDEALAAWQAIPIDLRRDKYRGTSDAVLNGLVAAGMYRSAAAVAADLAESEALKPTVGQVMNGGFESGVKLRKAGVFEWQIGEGAEPQIGLSEAQHHGGKYGLAMTFTAFKTEGQRDISQLIPLEPGSKYRLNLWYKNSIKDDARFKFALLDAKTGAVIASTAQLTPADWTEVNLSFQMPQGDDGAKLVLVRDGCYGPTCPASGTIVFDDITLAKE